MVARLRTGNAYLDGVRNENYTTGWIMAWRLFANNNGALWGVGGPRIRRADQEIMTAFAPDKQLRTRIYRVPAKCFDLFHLATIRDSFLPDLDFSLGMESPASFQRFYVGGCFNGFSYNAELQGDTNLYVQVVQSF